MTERLSLRTMGKAGDTLAIRGTVQNMRIARPFYEKDIEDFRKRYPSYQGTDKPYMSISVNGINGEKPKILVAKHDANGTPEPNSFERWAASRIFSRKNGVQSFTLDQTLAHDESRRMMPYLYQREFELDDQGNLVLDAAGNPKMLNKIHQVMWTDPRKDLENGTYVTVCGELGLAGKNYIMRRITAIIIEQPEFQWYEAGSSPRPNFALNNWSVNGESFPQQTLVGSKPTPTEDIPQDDNQGYNANSYAASAPQAPANMQAQRTQQASTPQMNAPAPAPAPVINVPPADPYANDPQQAQRMEPEDTYPSFDEFGGSDENPFA